MSNQHGQRGPSLGTRSAVVLGLFAGTATGAGFLLAGIPNLELMSLVIGLAGVALGSRLGAVCGALAAGIYSLGSPYGVPAAWILGAQMMGQAGIGALGGLWVPLVWERSRGGGRLGMVLLAALLGFLGTTWYELVTTLAVLLGFGLDARVVLVGAVPFYLLHTGSNIVLFSIFFPPMAQRLKHAGSQALRGRIGAVALVVLVCASGVGISVQAQDQPLDQQSQDLQQGQQQEQTQTGEQLLDAGQDSLPALEALPSTSAPDSSVHGWQRGLWHPFSQSLVEFLGWHGDFITLQDGGLGAPVRILGEFSTNPYPLVLRDGLPLGTGNILADDPGLMPVAGMNIRASSFGLDSWGGSGGQLQLQRLDPAPTEGFSSYQGTTGPHETYMRNVQLLTPRAPWRFGFEYQENLDIEGYNFTNLPGEVFDPVLDDYFPGHAKLRQSHARLTRDLGQGNRLDVDYDYGRKTKDQLPALAAEHQEIWADGVSVDMRAGTDRLRLRTAIFWRNRDVQLKSFAASPDTFSRLLNTGSEGLLFELSFQHQSPPRSAAAPTPVDSLAEDGIEVALSDSTEVVAEAEMAEAESPPVVFPPSATRTFRLVQTKLRLSVNNWALDDSGPDTNWAGPQANSVHLDGQQAVAVVSSEIKLAGLQGHLQAGGLWTDRQGWDSTAGVKVGWDRGRFGSEVFWETGGRAPRSDELGTILRHDVAGRILILDPNEELGREKTRRLGSSLGLDAVGLKFAVTTVAGELTDGITWLAGESDPNRGQWINGANLDYKRITAAVEHQGRFLGWGRVRYEGTWQDFSSTGQPASFLPPDQYSRLQLMWENHLFVEDGILELAFFSTHVGAMSDPWDVTRTYTLPAYTVQDLIVGFRLVGANLSLAFRNLTNQQYRTSAGARSPGSGTVMRLAWGFRR